jgi:capsular exopolysaccharide synthesis family protein
METGFAHRHLSMGKNKNPLCSPCLRGKFRYIKEKKLGKIADAINKYTKERYGSPGQQVTQNDLAVLLTYDRETGHLLKYDKATGKVDHSSMDIVKDRELIQRLLENNLIFPGGKLTPEGLTEVEKFEKQSQPPQASATQDTQSARLLDKKSIHPSTVVEVERKAGIHEPFPKEEKPQTREPEKVETITPIHVKQSLSAIPKKKPPVVNKLEPVKVVKAEREESKEPSAEVPLIDAVGKETVKEKADSIPDQPTVEATRSNYNAADIDKNLVSLLDPHSYEAEQFKILRTNILYPISGKPPRSILVTSAFPAEGKSFVASNLAISIALNINKHVLLMDCDLRKPELHSRFGFRDSIGLSNYLTDETPLTSLLLKSEVDKLTILPGGPIPLNPSELMSSERMEALIKEVRSRYQDRLIVIDAPPPSMAAETGFLSRHVDGIILVVKYGKTPKDQIADLIQSIGTDKIIGSVINNVDPNTMKYYSYKKYSKYGKRYKK